MWCFSLKNNIFQHWTLRTQCNWGYSVCTQAVLKVARCLKHKVTTYRIHKSLLSSLILSCLSYNLQTLSALLALPEGNWGGSCPESGRRRVRLLLDTPSIKALQLKSKKKQRFNAYFTKQNINNIKWMEFEFNSQRLKFRLKCQNRCLKKEKRISLCLFSHCPLSLLTCFTNLYRASMRWLPSLHLD